MTVQIKKLIKQLMQSNTLWPEIMARGSSQKSEIRHELKNSCRRENREFLPLMNLSWRNTPLKARQEDIQKSTVIPFGNRWQTKVTHAGSQIQSNKREYT